MLTLLSKEFDREEYNKRCCWNFFRRETCLERVEENFDKGHVVHLRGQWMFSFFFFQGERVRDSSNCRGCLARGGLQRVPSRASRVCIKEGAGTANGSQESSKGGLEFVSPLSDVCWTCRQQSAYSALSPRIFFLSSPHSSNPPIPLGVEWKLENGSSVSGIPDSKFHEREREREWEGIGNDVSPKVTDQPEFSRFLWISCVSIVKKKKNSVSRKGTIDPSNQDFPRSGISSLCGTNRSDNHCSKINRR